MPGPLADVVYIHRPIRGDLAQRVPEALRHRAARAPNRECPDARRGRGHGGVPRVWFYHPLPGQEGGKGDGRSGCGWPTLQQQGDGFGATRVPERES